VCVLWGVTRSSPSYSSAAIRAATTTRTAVSSPLTPPTHASTSACHRRRPVNANPRTPPAPRTFTQHPTETTPPASLDTDLAEVCHPLRCEPICRRRPPRRRPRHHIRLHRRRLQLQLRRRLQLWRRLRLRRHAPPQPQGRRPGTAARPLLPPLLPRLPPLAGRLAKAGEAGPGRGGFGGVRTR
jgi:hypothetical protein